MNKSSVWDHFNKSEDNNYAICKYCKKWLSYNQQTTSFFYHLRSKHEMNILEKKSAPERYIYIYIFVYNNIFEFQNKYNIISFIVFQNMIEIFIKLPNCQLLKKFLNVQCVMLNSELNNMFFRILWQYRGQLSKFHCAQHCH